MNELIKIHTDGQAVTDSLTIAAGAQVEHAAVMKLIRKYLPDFEAFGRVGFEIQPFETAGGTQKREVALLNEDQTTLLFTQAAKTLNYPPRKFKDYLRQIGFIYANSDTPMQEHIKAGRVVLRYAHYTTSDGNPVEKPYTHITSKGLKWLYERMVRDGLIEQQQDLFDKTA